MANWAIGFNSALKSGWDTWNKLGGVRQAAARAQAADQVAANNKALENDNASLNGIANDMRADQVNQALTDTFGDASEATKAGAREYGILKDDGSLDYGKLQEYGQKFGAQPQQAIPAQGAGAPPVVTDPQAEPVPQGQAIPTGGVPQADPGVASVRDQMMSQGQRAFDENAKAQRAINEDIAQAKYDRAVETGKKNREAMHEYNKWYNPDALEKEDEYQLNQTFKAMGKLVDANDPGAMEFMARAYSAMGNGNIRSNGDGTFTMVDKSGAPMGEAFKPSMQQFGTLMTNLYNTARLMKTWDPEAYLKTRKAMAETEGAELKNVGQGYKNEQEKVAANVANKYGEDNAAADNRSKNAAARSAESKAIVDEGTQQFKIEGAEADATVKKIAAQVANLTQDAQVKLIKQKVAQGELSIQQAKQAIEIARRKENREAEKYKLQKSGQWPSGSGGKGGKGAAADELKYGAPDENGIQPVSSKNGKLLYGRHVSTGRLYQIGDNPKAAADRLRAFQQKIGFGSNHRWNVVAEKSGYSENAGGNVVVVQGKDKDGNVVEAAFSASASPQQILRHLDKKYPPKKNQAISTGTSVKGGKPANEEEGKPAKGSTGD